LYQITTFSDRRQAIFLSFPYPFKSKNALKSVGMKTTLSTFVSARYARKIMRFPQF